MKNQLVVFDVDTWTIINNLQNFNHPIASKLETYFFGLITKYNTEKVWQYNDNSNYSI